MLKDFMKSARTFCSIIGVASLTFGIGMMVSGVRYQHAAIQSGSAHFDPKTGNFEWGPMIQQATVTELFNKALEEPLPSPKVAVKPFAKKKSKTNVT